MPNADVFISYRRDDRERVLVVAEKLQELGLTVWFDARLEAGTSFDEEINREVRSAKAVFVCWSPEAGQSRWVRAEASIGLERDVLVAAFLAPTELMPPYNLVHAQNLIDWNGEQDAPEWRDVLARIGRLVGKPDLPDLARAKALDASWAEQDAAAKSDFAAKLAEARERFAALHEARPTAFAQSLAEMEAAFQTWLMKRRTGEAGEPPDPLTLVEDQAEALQNEIETLKRERDAAITALARHTRARPAGSTDRTQTARSLEAEDELDGPIESPPRPQANALTRIVATLFLGPLASIWFGRRYAAALWLVLFIALMIYAGYGPSFCCPGGESMHRYGVGYAWSSGIYLLLFAALLSVPLLAEIALTILIGRPRHTPPPQVSGIKQVGLVLLLGPFALIWLQRRLLAGAWIGIALLETLPLVYQVVPFPIIWRVLHLFSEDYLYWLPLLLLEFNAVVAIAVLVIAIMMSVFSGPIDRAAGRPVRRGE